MAKNTGELKRIEVKYIRDGIKSKYPEKVFCLICDTTEDLEFHHYHSVDLLWEKWKKANNIKVETAEEIMEVREQFYADHYFELVDDGACLCNEHHKLLHKIYGVKPLLTTAAKQRRWARIQREKRGLEWPYPDTTE